MAVPITSTIRGTRGDDWFDEGYASWAQDDDGPLYVDRTGQMVEIPDDLDVDAEDRFSVIPLISARMQFKARKTDTEPIVALSEGAGIDAAALADGLVLPELTPAQTRLLSGGYFDVEAITDGNEVETIAKGNYIFEQDVSDE